MYSLSLLFPLFVKKPSSKKELYQDTCTLRKRGTHFIIQYTTSHSGLRQLEKLQKDYHNQDRWHEKADQRNIFFMRKTNISCYTLKFRSFHTSIFQFYPSSRCQLLAGFLNCTRTQRCWPNQHVFTLDANILSQCLIKNCNKTIYKVF